MGIGHFEGRLPGRRWAGCELFRRRLNTLPDHRGRCPLFDKMLCMQRDEPDPWTTQLGANESVDALFQKAPNTL